MILNCFSFLFSHLHRFRCADKTEPECTCEDGENAIIPTPCDNGSYPLCPGNRHCRIR